jgi:hypothetical protein
MPLSISKNGITGVTDFSITGNQTIGNTLSVTGVSTLNTTALGATSVTSNLTVSANTTTSNLTVSDNTTTSNLSVTGAVLLTTPLPVAQGGTGSSTLTANAVVVGNSTGTGHTFISPGSAGNALLSNGTIWFSATSTGTGNNVLAIAPAINTPTVTNYIETQYAIGIVTTTATINLANGTVQTATLTASTACVFTMPSVGSGKSFFLYLKQAPSTGAGSATFTGVKYNGAGTPTVTTTAGTMDIFTFVSDGTNWYGSASQGYTP